MDFKCDTYCCHETHPFIYKLSQKEKEYIQQIAHDNIYKNKKISINHLELTQLLNQLNEYFNANPTRHYFLKLNKLSPKDAYYIMTKNSVEDSEEDSDLTLNDIKRDLDILHVGFPNNRVGDYCINILLNSDRVYCELSFSDIEENISVLLLNYKDINHITETRCYIQNNKLIGISQYYCDLDNVYSNFNLQEIPNIIKKFIININTDLISYVCDIYFDDKFIPHLIELNPFKHSTDSCLFEWEKLDLEPYEFRYKENKLIKTIPLN